jgi:hypothetical protein
MSVALLLQAVEDDDAEMIAQQARSLASSWIVTTCVGDRYQTMALCGGPVDGVTWKASTAKKLGHFLNPVLQEVAIQHGILPMLAMMLEVPAEQGPGDVRSLLAIVCIPHGVREAAAHFMHRCAGHSGPWCGALMEALAAAEHAQPWHSPCTRAVHLVVDLERLYDSLIQG